VAVAEFAIEGNSCGMIYRISVGNFYTTAKVIGSARIGKEIFLAHSSYLD